MTLEDGVRALLELPRGQQVAAAMELLDGLEAPVVREEWNTAFGPGSLFEAWTRTTVASGVYTGNAEVLRPLMDERPNWTIVEVGAGNGELWRRLFRENDRGRLIAIDPSEQALAELRRHLPFGVELDALTGRIEDRLPLDEDADAVLCSLTLHHVAGRDAAERGRHGLEGLGKLEVLRAFADLVRRKDGLVLISEADIHCEVDLASGSDILRERLIDSYVRRCGRSILDDLEGADGDLAERWRHILRHWCVEQVRMADVPVAERDVYELDVGRWLEVFDAAGLGVERHRFTDAYGLFHQYVARPRGRRVTVEVSGVRNDEGQVIVGLYREAGFKRFGGAPVLRAEVPASEGTVTVVFDDVEPAAWAAGAYHDENGNGHLDLTMVGTPAEGRGYSVVAKVGLRAPTFAEACFEVFETDVTLPIALRYPG